MGQVTLGSLFDGIGGFPYAASFYGIRALWASEVMEDCISVTRRHFPEMCHTGDITKLHGGRLPPVDIITFGSPCQGLSLAGKRRGLLDERSGLFLEAVRVIYEMKEATDGRYPRFALWENVPGALYSAGGRDFKAVLEALTEGEVPMPRSGKWANAGMVRSGRTDMVRVRCPIFRNSTAAQACVPCHGFWRKMCRGNTFYPQKPAGVFCGGRNSSARHFRLCWRGF